MREDGTKQIEALLQRYAKKRREQMPPFAQPPPLTRQLLLDEARRLHPPKPAGSRPYLNWLSIFWPRLAWAGAAAVAIGAICWALLHNRISPANGPEMAKHIPEQTEKNPEKELLSTKTKTETPGPPPGQKLYENQKPENPGMLKREEIASAPPPSPAAPLPLVKSAPVVAAKPQINKAALEAQTSRDGASPAAPTMAGAEVKKLAEKESTGAVIALATPPSDAAERQKTAVKLANADRFAATSPTADVSVVANLATAPNDNEGIASYYFRKAQAFQQKQNDNQNLARRSAVVGRAADAAQTARKSAEMEPAPVNRLYARTSTDKLKKTEQQAATNILPAFILEQEGRQIRLMDADGSVYAGQIESAPPELQASSESKLRQRMQFAEETNDAEVTTNNASGSQLLSFQAIGTNRQFNQVVNIKGVLISQQPPQAQTFAVERSRESAPLLRGGLQNPPAGAAAAPGTVPSRPVAADGRTPVPENVQKIEIKGWIQIGNSPQFRFRAVSE